MAFTDFSPETRAAATKCGAMHRGFVCELATRHAGEHFGTHESEFGTASSRWSAEATMTLREIIEGMRKIPRVFEPSPRTPKPVYVAPEAWASAWGELSTDPRIVELYGVPVVAPEPLPNFLLMGVPVVPDERVPMGVVRQ